MNCGGFIAISGIGMASPLFRPQAIEANRYRLLGSVSVSTPPYRWLMVLLVGLLTVSIVSFLVLGSYTRRERVTGELLPSEGLLNVASPIAGTLTQVRVNEGESIAVGAAIAEISGEVSTALGATHETIARELAKERVRLQDNLAGQHQLSVEAVQGWRTTAEMLHEELTHVGQQQQQRTRQVELEESHLQKLLTMRSEGFASNSQVEQQQNALLDAQARLSDLGRQRIEVGQQLQEIEQKLRAQPLNEASQLNDIRGKLDSVTRDLAQNESQRSVILRAPDSSVVATLLVKPGQVVGAGQTVASLLPEGARLEARLMVPSSGIGFIRIGQRVVLRYQAFPYEKFGQQSGHVTEISRTALSPQEVATLTGSQNVSEQYYRVNVALDRQDIQVYGHAEKLKPGMAVDADVLVDKRRLYEWALEPLYAIGRKMAP